MSVIRVESLRTVLGGREIHKSVSFEVQKGEIFTVIGSSGSGKSTLLRELIMLQKPNGGEIEILGKDISKLDESGKKEFLKEIGVLFQSSALFSYLSVLQNIKVPLRELAGMDDRLADKIALYKLSLVGLEPYAAALYPSELSGGMKKRVALARALSLEPSILFLDEPTSGLDPISSRAFDRLIVELRDTLGLTFVIITHDIHTVRDISDKILALHDGTAVFCGNSKEVVASKHPFLESFFDVGERYGDQG